MKKIMIIGAILALNSCANNYKLACDEVISYIEETMDSGQMDEFLESPQGKKFIKHYYNK